MRPNDDNETFPDEPDDDFDESEPPFPYYLHSPRPRVRAWWGSFVVEFEVGFDDDIPSRARTKLADKAAAWMVTGLRKDNIRITATSHAWVVQASVGGSEVTAHLIPHGEWFPAVKEQVYAMVVASFATDPWAKIAWVD